MRLHRRGNRGDRDTIGRSLDEDEVDVNLLGLRDGIEDLRIDHDIFDRTICMVTKSRKRSKGGEGKSRMTQHRIITLGIKNSRVGKYVRRCPGQDSLSRSSKTTQIRKKE